MAKDNVTWQPKWVPLSILDFARIIHNFGDDNDSLANWVRKMAEDLLFCNTDSEDELTKDMLTIANEKYSAKSAAGKKGGKASAKARKQRNTGSATPADKREQGDDNTANDASGVGPEPDSHLNGDALSGDASDREITRESAVADCTTVSEQFEARQSQNADGTDINWHEAVCQALGTTDGYDQETETSESQTGAGAAPLQTIHVITLPHRVSRASPSRRRTPKKSAISPQTTTSMSRMPATGTR